MQPRIHLIDETWIDCAPFGVAAAVSDATNWARWWPTLNLTVTRDRGVKGMQWSASGWLAGTVEIWLEPVKFGVILHHYLRLDPPADRVLGRRKVDRLQRDFAWHAKRVFWRLKDDLENNR
jgi:hypothetical protein